jgi:GNAT superfamily N-acetyltransferase
MPTPDPAHDVREAATDAEIAACWPVMQQLRPHVAEAAFVARVRRQMQSGYRLAFFLGNGRVRAVAGFRLGENLAWGAFLYVDDLVTDEAARGTGCGQALFDWLVALAQTSGCAQIHLDSGVQRFGAHRFYLQRRMDITSHHFALKLGG